MTSKSDTVSPIRDDRQIVIHPTDDSVDVTVGEDISIMDLWCAIGTLQQIANDIVARNRATETPQPSPIVTPRRRVD